MDDQVDSSYRVTADELRQFVSLHVFIYPAGMNRRLDKVGMTQDVLQKIRIGTEAFDTKFS